MVVGRSCNHRREMEGSLAGRSTVFRLKLTGPNIRSWQSPRCRATRESVVFDPELPFDARVIAAPRRSSTHFPPRRGTF